MGTLSLPNLEDQKNLEPSKVLEGILKDALESKASDIHFEPQANSLLVRFRIDGVIHTIATLGKDFHEPFVGTIKVVSNLDITNKRTPQDGSYHITSGDVKVNFRISTFPTIHGEAVVIRILNKASALINLKDLGFDQNQYNQVLNIIKNPYGILLISGPTGSGKTSLLYSVLHELKKPTVNIVSIEDPIEYLMEGVRQTNVNEFGELTFTKALRGTLRQDPDIIMIGEIRDASTAEIGFQAALSGRFVLSTFHTFNLLSIVSRLNEMGVPKSIITNSLMGVVSSRLVRTICSSCKQPYTLSEYEKNIVGSNHPDVVFYKGAGCEKCRNTGYLGRTGIFNVVPFDEEIRFFVAGQHSENELKEVYAQKNIKTLEQSALDKVALGETTMEEVTRVLGLI